MDRESWLQWRHHGIGSSDAAAVHGMSEYRTAYELWMQKIQPAYDEPGSTFVTQIGNDLEPIARRKFAALWNIEHNTQEEFEPRMIILKDLPFMRATLDGSSFDGKVIIECKYQGKDNHANVAHMIVRDDYKIQVQHQLLVSGAERAYLVSINDNEEIEYCEILPDIDFHRDHIKACAHFWEHVVSREELPMSDKDWRPLKKRGSLGKVNRWKYLNMKIKEMEAERDDLREEVLAMVDKPRMICNGVKFSLVAGRAGGIDYAALIKDKGIPADEAEKYRKPAGKPYYKMEDKS